MLKLLIVDKIKLKQKIFKWVKQNSYEKSVHPFTYLLINTYIYFLNIYNVPAIVKMLGI